ncbi:hypothetical protein GJ633_04650 [Halorubrum sp. CBA1125]|nr:hypothetical protein [Halorubrum sp. CBA1125]
MTKWFPSLPDPHTVR